MQPDREINTRGQLVSGWVVSWAVHFRLEKATKGRCIAVLGMGRSGTSAIAGALQLMGADLGRNLVAANEQNPKGYFENASVVRFNQNLLRSLGSFNGDFGPLDNEDRSGAREQQKDLVTLLKCEFGHSPLIAVKDPRLCRVWPIWAEALDEDGRRPVFILMLRHPLEVAQSLHYFNCATNSGLLWWITHTMDAAWRSRAGERIILRYEDLLANPRRALEDIAAALEVVWPGNVDGMEQSLNGFVDGSLRHHSVFFRGSQQPGSHPARTQRPGPGTAVSGWLRPGREWGVDSFELRDRLP